MSWTKAFSPSRTADARKSDRRMRLTTFTHSIASSVNMNLKASHEARPQKKSDRGISRALMTVAYLRVPELTTPLKNMKMRGRRCATSLPCWVLSAGHGSSQQGAQRTIQRENHDISSQTKSQKRLTLLPSSPPSDTRSLSKLPVKGRQARGMARTKAMGKMKNPYLVKGE